jgi:hypothetical protein
MAYQKIVSIFENFYNKHAHLMNHLKDYNHLVPMQDNGKQASNV